MNSHPSDEINDKRRKPCKVFHFLLSSLTQQQVALWTNTFLILGYLGLNNVYNYFTPSLSKLFPFKSSPSIYKPSISSPWSFWLIKHYFLFHWRVRKGIPRGCCLSDLYSTSPALLFYVHVAFFNCLSSTSKFSLASRDTYLISSNIWIFWVERPKFRSDWDSVATGQRVQTSAAIADHLIFAPCLLWGGGACNKGLKLV